MICRRMTGEYGNEYRSSRSYHLALLSQVTSNPGSPVTYVVGSWVISIIRNTSGHRNRNQVHEQINSWIHIYRYI